MLLAVLSVSALVCLVSAAAKPRRADRDSGAVRFRPKALTAVAMIVGAAVILFDPIFQGLAISLMAGEAASLLLSRMAVPVLYYMAKRHERTEPVPTAAPMKAVA